MFQKWKNFINKISKNKKYNIIKRNVIYNKPKKNTYFLEKVISVIIYFSLRIGISNVYFKENKSKIKDLVKIAYNKLASREFSFMPSGFAFYLLISIIPMITIIVSLTSINVQIYEYNWNEFLRNEIILKIIPGLNEQVIPNTISFFSNQWQGNVTLAIILITSIWISSTGLGNFITSQSIVYDHKNLGNIFLNRIKGIVGIICISLYFSIIFYILTPIYISLKWWLSANILAYQIIFYVSLSFIFLCTTYLGFALVFRFTPLFKVTWRQIHPGSIITAIPTTLFTIIFGFITSGGWINYDRYGSIATFMYLASLLITTSYFIYFGLITNNAFYKTFFKNITIRKSKKI